MNLPNSLTIVRIFFVPLLVAVLVQEGIILDFPLMIIMGMAGFAKQSG